MSVLYFRRLWSDIGGRYRIGNGAEIGLEGNAFSCLWQGERRGTIGVGGEIFVLRSMEMQMWNGEGFTYSSEGARNEVVQIIFVNSTTGRKDEVYVSALLMDDEQI